ncbi:VOC family protein [Dyella japonica]|uniref:VOC family protein n=1 Tax=Dyella japonica TaxID=231455 RepID=UPI00062D949C|nr:VOC family protein [Dyella japonica]
MSIPGIKKVDHVGFTVPNLDEAVSFFRDHFGCEVAYEFGPFAANDDWMAVHLNVAADAVIDKIVMMTAGNTNLEIFGYATSETQHKTPPRNSDIGGHHLAFYVDDMDAAVAYLHQIGLTVMGEPTVMTQGPSAGETWIYFLSPWGMQLELVSYPNGKAYQWARGSVRRGNA